MAFKPIISICIVALLAVTGAFGQAEPDTTNMIAADSAVTLEQVANDSMGVVEQIAPSPDSVAADDTLAIEQTDSVSAPTAVEPVEPVRRGNDEIVGEVIPWDWDDFTNVIEVGIRTERGREYELEKNNVYQKIWDHFLGLEIRLFGDASRDDDGFYFFRVDEFEMADSTAKPPVKLP